jgi:hypothetical protein
MKSVLTREMVAGRKIDSLWQTNGHPYDKNYFHVDFFVKLDTGCLFPMGGSEPNLPVDLGEIDYHSLLPLPQRDAEHAKSCISRVIIDICCAYWSPYFSILLDNKKFLWIDIASTLNGNDLGFYYFFEMSDAANLDLEGALTYWDQKPVRDLLK